METEKKSDGELFGLIIIIIILVIGGIYIIRSEYKSFKNKTEMTPSIVNESSTTK